MKKKSGYAVVTVEHFLFFYNEFSTPEQLDKMMGNSKLLHIVRLYHGYFHYLYYLYYFHYCYLTIQTVRVEDFLFFSAFGLGLIRSGGGGGVLLEAGA